MAGRWEWLEGVRKIDAAQAIGEELGRLLVGELRAWPPQIEWEDAGKRARFAPLYAPDARAPSQRALLDGLHLARLELERDPDAVGAFLREAGAGAAPHDALARELVWQWAYEAALVVLEEAHGRVRRKDLIGGLELAARLVTAS